MNSFDFIFIFLFLFLLLLLFLYITLKKGSNICSIYFVKSMTYNFEFVLRKLKTCLDLDYDCDSKGLSALEMYVSTFVITQKMHNNFSSNEEEEK